MELKSEKSDLYLLVLSILLGVSVLKLPELLLLADQIQDILLSLKSPGLSPTVVAVYFFTAGYIVFFFLVALAGYGVIERLRAEKPVADVGPLVGMCVVALAVSYLLVYSVSMYAILGNLDKVHFHK